MNNEEKFKIPEKVLKKIKTQAEFESFIQELYKQGVEALLKAEMHEHLGYPKHSAEGRNSGNSRNGYSGKTLKTNLGDIALDVPRDRNRTFEPIAVPKHQHMSAKIEHAIITMYSRGMTTRDIEATIKDIYGIEVSEGPISNITSAILEDIADLKLVYNAINRDMAYEALEEFAQKWNAKYAYSIKSWRDNWEEHTAYFDYPMEIRRIIYTTSVIESINSSIRKYTKAKMVFPDDQAVLKAVYYD